MSDSQRIKHEGTYSTWKIHQLTREGRRDGCLLGPIRVERLPRNFTVLKKKEEGGRERKRKERRKERNDFVSGELVAGCLMTHRLTEYTSISSENYRYIPTYFIRIIASTSSATPSVSSFFLPFFFFSFVRSRAMRVYARVYRADYTRYKSTHLRSLIGNLNVGTI